MYPTLNTIDDGAGKEDGDEDDTDQVNGEGDDEGDEEGDEEGERDGGGEVDDEEVELKATPTIASTTPIALGMVNVSILKIRLNKNTQTTLLL